MSEWIVLFVFSVSKSCRSKENPLILDIQTEIWFLAMESDCSEAWQDINWPGRTTFLRPEASPCSIQFTKLFWKIKWNVVDFKAEPQLFQICNRTAAADHENQKIGSVNATGWADWVISKEEQLLPEKWYTVFYQ